MAAIFASVQESEYELQRKRRIQENKEMLKKLFGDKDETWAATPSPTAKHGGKTTRTPGSGKQRRTPVGPIRRNPKRSARSYPSEDQVDNMSTDESDNDSEQGSNRLVVRWLGPLTKKRRTDSNTSSEQEFSDKSETRKPKVFSPRVIRPPSDFTEEELLLVASCAGDKRYDSGFGTSCHQCRQKTDDLKTICRNEACVGVRGQFCGPCLMNRYGETVRDALLDEHWHCPPCRNICNCSFCMVKRGRRCTGQLINVARQNGYLDVRSFLGD